MNCSRCGTVVIPGANFCGQCGAASEEVTINKPEDRELAGLQAAVGDRYRVESLLGRGGMGAVYRAHDPSLDRFVALKVIPGERSRDENFVARFKREARLAAKLRHPRIVSIHEVRAAGEMHYFAMDYVDGGTLRSLVTRRRGIPAEEAVPIMIEICKAVSHAHTRGIIHRDLKPENIMIDHDGELFVMDFGLARALEDPGLTESGQVMGTPLYMSPEQLSGEALDERTDIFSLGLIFYYCLTGENLFAANSLPAVISKQLSTDVAEVIGREGRIPAGVKTLLIGMLERKREKRTGSAREVVERLTILTGLTLPAGGTRSDEATVKLDAPKSQLPRESPPDSPSAAEPSEQRRARLRSLLNKI